MAGTVSIERPAPAVARLVLSNPGRKNAMDPALMTALAEALDHALNDESTHALVLTGAGGDFCAGGDISGLREIVPETLPERLDCSHRIIRALVASPKPVVAAVLGAAAGGGASRALACDQIVIGEGARFSIGFLRIGLIPDLGALHSLPRRVGRGAARRILLDQQPIGAQEARAIGLSDEVAGDEVVQEAAVARALRLAAHPPAAWAATKRLFGRSARPTRRRARGRGRRAGRGDLLPRPHRLRVALPAAPPPAVADRVLAVFEAVPRRWVVEGTFAWLSRSCRLARDYERLPETSGAMIHAAMSRIMLQRIAA